MKMCKFRLSRVVGVVTSLALLPVVSFAQTTTTSGIDASSVVSALTANNSAITDVGLAVLTVLALIVGIKYVRRAM